ncbi:MAG: flagellar hook protein FlgE [Acidobacteriaceae bacterium]|nr:flagellar hook protein FlgE [Acidobacteriaceae bacterium]
MASFSIPLTGLKADTTALNTIANNLANMNTTAFKAQTTQFSDLFYQAYGDTGAGDPIQVGAGVQVSTNTTDFTRGSISSTGVDTDVAIAGDEGFFVVDNGSGGYEYTRAGNFTLTSAGELVTSNGLSVMGYPATNGTVSTSSALTAITIPVGTVQQPQATTTLSLTGNLDSADTTGTSYPGTVTVYDSLGQSHVVTITYTQTAANTWSYSAELPATDYTSGTSTPITGTLTFDSSGVLTSVTTGGVTSTVGTATGDISSIPLAFTGLADGASDLNISWNLLDSSNSPTISQVDSTSTFTSTSQNGYTSSDYSSFTIASDGTVSVVYASGNTDVVGQIALANVTNVQGLDKLGDGDYSTTVASGSATVGIPGSGGLGTLESSALEGSNVNISQEFADLIVAQRAFEANSKAVTTFDTVTQDTINMIH